MACLHKLCSGSDFSQEINLIYTENSNLRKLNDLPAVEAELLYFIFSFHSLFEIALMALSNDTAPSIKGYVPVTYLPGIPLSIPSACYQLNHVLFLSIVVIDILLTFF